MLYQYANAKIFAAAIHAYFYYLEGVFHWEEAPAKSSKSTAKKKPVKIWDRLPEPPTLSGLALHMGFKSRQELDDYLCNGRHAKQLSLAKLRIEAEYEKRLHIQSCTGAVFALKNMGWNERANQTEGANELVVRLTESGPAPADSEDKVDSQNPGVVPHNPS